MDFSPQSLSRDDQTRHPCPPGDSTCLPVTINNLDAPGGPRSMSFPAPTPAPCINLPALWALLRPRWGEGNQYPHSQPGHSRPSGGTLVLQGRHQQWPVTGLDPRAFLSPATPVATQLTLSPQAPICAPELPIATGSWTLSTQPALWMDPWPQEGLRTPTPALQVTLRVRSPSLGRDVSPDPGQCLPSLQRKQ